MGTEEMGRHRTPRKDGIEIEMAGRGLQDGNWKVKEDKKGCPRFRWQCSKREVNKKQKVSFRAEIKLKSL